MDNVVHVLVIILVSDPWEYLVFGGAGTALFYNIPIWEAKLTADINQQREARNMPPLQREGATLMFGG
jgi:hypothetical protein